MRLRFTFLLAGLLLCAGIGRAQNAVCGTDALNARRAAADPAFAARMQQSVNQWMTYKAQQSMQRAIINGTDTVFEIPIVIHVMRPVPSPAIGNYNPADTQLVNMVDFLNQTYAATWPGYAPAGAGGTVFPVRFVLAKRDTACNPTSGILRVDASSLPAYAANGINNDNTNGADDPDVKALSHWPVADYYNIWIVNKIDGVDGYPGSPGPFTAGYAYYPNGTYTDGTVMLASQARSGRKTLPHELGHAFFLRHTFEGDNGGAQCPINNNCATDGDGVCDTEPHKRSTQNCPSGNNPCTGRSYNNVVNNIMDYSSCADRFTPGQRERFLWALRTFRPGLISSMGAVAPPAASPIASCIPSAPAPNAGFDAGPSRVMLGGMTGESAGGYASDDNRTYLDKSCLYTATVAAGNTYPLEIETNSSQHKVRVWIDLNNNGIFDNAELIYSANGGGTNGTFTSSWSVPATGVVTCTPLRMRVIADQTSNTTISPCGPLTNGQAEDYTVYIKDVLPTATVSLAPGSANPSCTGTPLTFTVTPSGNFTSPSYQWYVNNTLQSGATGTSFTTSAPANNDRVWVKMRFSSTCGGDSVNSADFIVQRAASVAPTVSIAITSGAACAGQPVSFAATGTNLGTSPSFAWKVNGVTVATTSVSTYATSTLSAGDVVTVTVTSSSSCATPATATSNALTIQYGTATPAVSITSSNGTASVCSGTPVTFTATPVNGGQLPLYEWFVNNTPQPTAGNVFVYTPSNGDSVRATLYSSNPCAQPQTATSNSITLTVLPIDTPRITIAITRGTNPSCVDSPVTFTATVSGLGSSAAINWFVNGTQVDTGVVFTSSTLQNGDIVNAVASTAATGCRTTDIVASASITISRTTPPLPPAISFINSQLIANVPNVVWYNVNGRIPGATGQTYRPPVSGLYFARATDGACESDSSNLLRVSMMSVSSLDISTLQLFPNPTNGKVTLRWSTMPAKEITVSVFNNIGQRMLVETATHTTEKVISLGAFADGQYFFVLRDETGNAATIPVTLRR